MGYVVTHRNGEMEDGYPVDQIGRLYDELLKADSEHPDVAVTHESEWCLTVLKSGFLVLENLEKGEPKHVGPVNRDEAIELMMALANGLVDDLHVVLWRPGYPPR